MNKNLDVDKFRNGSPIPESKTIEEWQAAGKNKQPAWCYYENYAANGSKYGKLYNWYAVNDYRGLAPAGWHVSTDEEWTILENSLGGDAGKKMKSSSGWSKNWITGEDGNGTNTIGFTGLPGGLSGQFGGFDHVGESGYWWSASEHDVSSAWARGIFCIYPLINRIDNVKASGFSVRCVRD
jgi:uncharacterized protein (TIGR02145 family)